MNKHFKNIAIIMVLIMFFTPLFNIPINVKAIRVESIDVLSKDGLEKIDKQDSEKTDDNEKYLENALKSLEWLKLKAESDKHSNASEIVKDQLKIKGFEDVNVEVIESTDTDYISENGRITYFYKDLDKPGTLNTKNVNTTFKLSKGNSFKLYKKNVIIGIDIEKVKNFLEENVVPTISEMEIKGENKDLNNVEKDLILPVRPVKFASVEWSTLDKESMRISNELQQNGSSSLSNPLVGKPRRGDDDKKVRLTATIKHNYSDVVINKHYDITVKGLNGSKELENVRKEFEEKYTAQKIRDSYTGGQVDLNKVTGDLALPTPRNTEIKNNFDYQFTAKSNSENISINGFGVKVKRPMIGEEPVKGSFTVTMKGRKNDISVSKDFELNIMPLTQEEIDEEIKLMEKVKDSYPKLMLGKNSDIDNVTENLQSFAEVYLDNDELKIITNKLTSKEVGIYVDDLAKTSDLNESGYQEQWNKFKSSNPNVIQHENLVVHREEKNKNVKIESILTSRKYGKYAEQYPENESFKKLYKQNVSVDFKVIGTKNIEDDEKDDEFKSKKFKLRIEANDKTILPEREVVVDSLDLSYADISNEFKQIKPIHVIAKGLKEGTDIDVSDDEQFDHSNGTFIKKIGDTEMIGSMNGWMYYVNNKYANQGVSQFDIEENDEIVVFFVENYMENTFTFFNQKEANIKTNENLEVKINGTKFDMYSGKTELVKIKDANILINNEKSEIFTDSEGNAILKFDKAGKYTISAERFNSDNERNITRPYMVVNVEKSDEKPDEKPNEEPKEDSKFDIEYIGSKKIENEKEFNAKLKLTNLGDKDEDVLLIIGLYNEVDRLVNYSMVNQKINANKTIKIGTGFLVPTEGRFTSKVYLWDSLENQNILMEKSLEFND